MRLKLTNKNNRTSVARPALHIVLLLLSVFPFSAVAQEYVDSTFILPSSLNADADTNTFNRGRVRLVAGLNVAIYAWSLFL